MKLAKTSWLYRSAEFHYNIFKGKWGNDFEYTLPSEFCTFFRQYTLRVVRDFILGLLFALAAYSMIWVIFVGIFGIGLTNTFLDVFGFACWWVVFSVTAGGSVVMLIEWVRGKKKYKRYYDDDGNRIHGPIMTAYKAWKEKHCPLLEITE